MKNKFLFSFFLSFVFCFFSCNKDDNPVIKVENSGILTGKVLSKNGSKPIGGAIVFTFDEKDEMYFTYSDKNGVFSLNAPAGNRKINIQTGGGTNFRTEIDVTIIKDKTVTIAETESRLNQTARMAYLSGNYDNIQDIVSSMGYDIELLTLNDLNNYNKMEQYDIIFLNCSSAQKNNLFAQENLSKFVTNGGSLYVSDWSIAFLLGGIINTTSCNSAGGFIPDNTICSINNGEQITIPNAQITSTELSNAIGFSSLSIEYDLAGWQQIESIDPTYWDVLVNNTSNQKALMIKTDNYSNPTQISNLVGNDANDGWVTICHIPPGNSNNPITITINQNALQTHLNHGDSLGSCSNASNNGTIYYTTFHNHASHNIGNSESILEYVILNL